MTPAGRTIRRVAAWILAASLTFVVSCDDLAGPEGGYPRTYAIGVTDFPHASTTEAIHQAWDVIAADCDLAVLHFDGGVPWQEALDGAPYPPSFQQSIDLKLSRLPGGHVVYLAITPINSGRSGLAGYVGGAGNQPLPPPWDEYDFDEPDVVDAYVAHCGDMIELFRPDYFAYAIEANMLAYYGEQHWETFLSLAAAVYTTVKSTHPGLPVFVTLQADTYHNATTEQAAAISQLLFYTDMIAVSGYPFTARLADPTLLRSDYFSALADLSPGKPFAVAETAWPAEDITEPALEEFRIEADQATQLAYLERVVEDCDYLNARFICWFFSRDYDEAWEDYFQFWPDAPTFRIWRDTGLYNGYGDPRPSLAAWHQALARPLVGIGLRGASPR